MSSGAGSTRATTCSCSTYASPNEWSIARLEGSLCISLSELAERVHELDPARPTVCICHHGIRSHGAALALLRMGFAQVYNLAGGVDRWAVDVDSRMPRY